MIYSKEQARKIMLDHFTKPNNKGLIKKNGAIYLLAESQNCSDKFDIEIYIHRNTILEIKYEGSACAVASSAADILCDELKEKNIEDTIKFIENYHKMLENDLKDLSLVSDLSIFSDLYQQKSRVICAKLLSKNIYNFLLNNKEK